MNIEVSLLKEVIDEMIGTIQKKVNGDKIPTLSKYEALRELGVIYELLISLLEKLDDKQFIVEVLVIKEKVVNATQKIIGF